MLRQKNKSDNRLDHDIVAMTGYWEPNSFAIRGGIAHEDIETFEYPYSEQIAKKLSKIGINLVSWHYYKGLGIKMEEEEMQKTAQFFKHCEKYGISKGVYINAGSVFADTFIAENPEAKDWMSYDQWGEKQQYSEYYRCYYRWRPCSNNKEFGDYFGRAAVKAIKEAGADFIHFDNSSQMPCYCQKCQKGFVEYLLIKYPAEPRDGTITFKERFGHDFKGSFQLPRGTARQPIDNLPSAREPGIYEWVNYRQQLYEKLLDKACTLIRDASSAVRIMWNPPVDEGEFSGLVWGLDPESSYRCGTNYFFSEDGNSARIEDGRLISRIRTYKYGRATGNKVLVHNASETNNDQKLLNYVEAAVFNDGCLGRVMWATDPDDGRLDFTEKAIGFLREYKEIYVHSKCISKVAVYRCHESEVANWADDRISRLSIEQTLILNSIQYDQIINDTFDDINNYELLICANTISISDTVTKKIGDFVRSGGKVLCTGASFSRNEYGQRRKFVSDMGLAGERDKNLGRINSKGDVSEILSYLNLEKEFGSRIFYLPKIDLAKEFLWNPQSSELPRIDHDYFVEALNKEVIVEMVEEASDGNNLKITAPDNVIAGHFRTKSGERIIHILDYESHRTLSNVKVRVKIDKTEKISGKFVTIDSSSDIVLQSNGTMVTCTMPPFKTYGFLWFY
jgi:hypothetical protein